MATIYTVGHGARSAEELVSILKEAGIHTLVDVRAFPALRTTGRAERSAGFAKAAMPWLVAHGHKVVHLLAEGRMREHALHPQEDLWRDV